MPVEPPRPAVPGDDEAIELLQTLLSIPSPSGAERAASDALVAWMRQHGLHAQVDEVGNAVGTRGNGRREILLLGHIDTFPGDVPVRREGDVVYGRGSVDAKGALCAFAVAAARALDMEGWKVTVVGAVEEEAATSRGARHVLTQRLPPRGSPPAYCVIGEPSRWDRITLGYKGRLLLHLTVRAPLAHSAGSERLPAEHGVALWQAIGAFCADWNARHAAGPSPFHQLSPSLRRITSAEQGAYGTAELDVGLRLPLAADPQQIEREVMAWALDETLGVDLSPDYEGDAAGPDGLVQRYRHPFAHGEGEIIVTVRGGEPAYRAGKSNTLVRSFLRAIRDAGGAPRFVVKTGTADMNVVAPAWPDTPIVAYGPGDSALDHTPREHVHVDEFVRSITVVEQVIGWLTGGSERSTS